MKTLVVEYPEAQKMAFAELGAAPQPGPGEILIRTQYSGITNGTERHAMMAEFGWKKFPGRHGYQHVGIVEKVGAEVVDFKTGDWVFYGNYVGHRGWNVANVGGVQKGVVVNHLVLKLPSQGFDYKQAALFGVCGVAMRGIRRCRVAAPHNVWVAGCGLIGQFAAQSARALGGYVTVSDVNEKRLELAKKVGAHRVVNAKTEGYPKLKEYGPFDRIVEACGLPSFYLDIHEHGLLAANQAAILSLAVRAESTFHWSTFHGREASIEVSCHFRLDDLKVLLHYVREGIIKVEPLITHFVPIEEAPKIYETMRDRPGDLLGVVFDWTK